VYIEIRNAVCRKSGRREKARRVKESRFRKSSPRKRKNSVDRWYAGVRVRITEKFPSGVSGNQRARKTKGLARETAARQRGESEREREITKASPLSGNCAMACRRGYLMATMQIPIPTLISVISRGTIEEGARTRLSLLGLPQPDTPLTLNRMLFFCFYRVILHLYAGK